ncbi:hypothetical protein [Mycobacterium colombiense]|nr:hypothetical protein [Mycobacterium colombiense]
MEWAMIFCGGRVFACERSQHPGQPSAQSCADADLVIQQIPVMQHHKAQIPVRLIQGASNIGQW